MLHVTQAMLHVTKAMLHVTEAMLHVTNVGAGGAGARTRDEFQARGAGRAGPGCPPSVRPSVRASVRACVRNAKKWYKRAP